MQQGRGGMGSHKHGTSGVAGKSPKLRLYLKRLAEAMECGRKRKKLKHNSVKDAVDKFKPR